MIKTKKLIEITSISEDGRYLDGYMSPLNKNFVELPDFSEATDLEKLEWVCKEIGAELCHSPWKDFIYVECNETSGWKFDKNGKLIK